VLGGPRPAPRGGDATAFVGDVEAALYASKIGSYAQGMTLIAAADRQYGYGIRLDEIARIWRGGCIIRAALLDDIKRTFRDDPAIANLLLAPHFRHAIAARQDPWRRTITAAIQAGIAVPASAASLAYYDTYRRARVPANLIQAQRDLFGAHTYRRIDDAGTFHMEWGKGIEHRVDAGGPEKKAA
jgi:6-phosphogluconate dehydrogenase